MSTEYFSRDALRPTVGASSISCVPAPSATKAPHFAPEISRLALVKGKHILLREVEEDDAAFILQLRLHPIKGRYLSPVDDDVEKQRAWIRNYRASTGQAYFIICDEGVRPLGAVRMYDAQGPSFSWGSWILSDAAPAFVAIESALLIYYVGTRHFGFTACHFQVHPENCGTLSFHRKLGAMSTCNGTEEVRMRIDLSQIEAAMLRYARYLPATVEIR